MINKLDGEVWKDLIGYEGIYVVSNMGRLFKLPCSRKGGSINGRFITGAKNGEGYWKVRLSVNKVILNTAIHRLVAMTFLPNPENKPRVNHIDNNPSNNKLSNLEWATHQEDIDHKCRQNRQHRPIGDKNPSYGKKGEKSPVFGKSYNARGKHGYARPVLDLATGIYYDCVTDAAEARGYNKHSLYMRLVGLRKNKTSIILI